MKKDYLIINLRVLAILLVVLGHSIIIFNPTWNYYIPKYNSSFLLYLNAIIYIFHMPLFFSISGFLYGLSNKKHKYNFFSLAKSKAKRIIIPYIFISLLWLLPIRLLVGYPNYDIHNQNVFRIILYNIVLGKDNGHLWFLPSLFIIFLIYYFISKTKKAFKYNILFFAFLCIISVVGRHFLPTYIGTAFSYLMWFGLGDLIREDIIYLEKNKRLIILFGILSIPLCVLYLFIYLKSDFSILQFVLNNAICLIWIPLLYCFFPRKKARIIEKIDKNSFGIYLFHSPLIYITFSNFNYLHPIIILLINFFVFGIIAYLLTSIVRKIGLGLLIGEKK